MMKITHLDWSKMPKQYTGLISGKDGSVGAITWSRIEEVLGNMALRQNFLYFMSSIFPIVLLEVDEFIPF